MYQLRADPVDFRDFAYQATGTPLKNVVDLRPWASRVEDQTNLGSCTGAAVIGAYELLLKKTAPSKFTELSSLFVYYNARVLEGFPNDDVGAYLRTAIKAVYKYGVCTEDLWPYHIQNFTLLPPIVCYEDGSKRMIKNYARLSGIADILDALNQERPVLIGVNLYDEFERLSVYNTVLESPTNDQSLSGAHALCLVGYDLDRQVLLCRNSFGEGWGLSGYFWMTFEYAERELITTWVFDIDLLEQ